jgi:acyl-CoA thioesterase
VTEDSARCSMPLTPMHLNAGGVAQGGAVYTLCDTTFAVAANAGGILTVSQCADMHYLRPGAGERLYAEASCVSAGRSTCLYRVNVTDGEDRQVAVCMVTGFRKAPVNKA